MGSIRYARERVGMVQRLVRWVFQGCSQRSRWTNRGLAPRGSWWQLAPRGHALSIGDPVQAPPVGPRIRPRLPRFPESIWNSQVAGGGQIERSEWLLARSELARMSASVDAGDLRWPTTGGHQRNAFWQLKTSVVCVQVRLAKENSVSSNADPSRPDRAGHNPRVGCL